MPLEYDPHTSTISYEGRVVGRYRVDGGKARVSLEVTYECNPSEWVVPLSWFDHGLSCLQKHQAPEADVALEVSSSEEDVEERFDVPRLLEEKTIKLSGFLWRFHRNDVDPWPSLLHGHDKSANLVLDALTGDAYDSTTRYLRMRLTKKELARIQGELRTIPEFAGRLPL